MKHLILIPLAGISLTSCITDTIDALRANQEAIEVSTASVQENIQAVQSSNAAIDENRRQLEVINQKLKKAGG